MTASIKHFLALAVLSAAILAGSASRATASDHVVGTITQRTDNGFSMRTLEGTTVTVSLTDRTKLRTNDGRGKWSTSELEPGLPVKVKGTVEGPGSLVAKEVKFSKDDRKLAQAIRAGLTPTDQRVQSNTAAIDRHTAAIVLQEQVLTAQQRELADHGSRLADDAARLAAASGAITRTNERIADLANYQELDSLTVYFANNRAKVDSKYLQQLAALAERAKGVPGYMVQVQGYASAVGSPTFNNDLSERRAQAVIEVLQQRGGIPSTNVLVPAAMGITSPVGDNHTPEGRSENRRVVVTLLQNQGVAQN